MLGGEKMSYIWTVNGSKWRIIKTISDSVILAEMYGQLFTSKWRIPKTVFDSEFIEAQDLIYPADLLKHQPFAAFSFRLLDPAYAGSCCKVRRSSDSTEQDIGFVNSYIFDDASYNTFIGAGNGFTRTFYSQFSADLFENANTPQQPQIVTGTGSNNRPAHIFDGSDDRLNANGCCNPFIGTDKPYSFACLVNKSNPQSNAVIWATATTAAYTDYILHQIRDTDHFQHIRRDGVPTTQIVDYSIATPGSYQITAGIFDYPNIKFWTNDQLFSFTADPLGAINPVNFTVGAITSKTTLSFFHGNIDELFIFDSAIGSQDMEALIHNMNLFYKVF